MSRTVHTRRLIGAVLTSLVISVVALKMFAGYASHHPDQVKLGDTVFSLGKAKPLGVKLAAEGPVFFNDLVREDNLQRPLVLAFLGGTDFAALNAQPPGSAEKCAVRAVRKTKTLVDPCTGDVYAYDGLSRTGKELERFTTEVNRKGVLSINLNKPYPESLRH